MPEQIDIDELVQKIKVAVADDDAGELHIFSGEEVQVLRKVISWVGFAKHFGILFKALFWIFTTIGGAYLMYGKILEGIKGG